MEIYNKEDALKYLIRNINKYEKWCGFTMFNSLQNENGTVSSVGGELSENIQKELENEYQQSLN